MNVSSKTMKQTFNNVRKSLRKYAQDEFKIVGNGLLETYNKNINLLKISTGQDLLNLEIKEATQSRDRIGYYNYKGRDIMINIDDIERNKEKILEYIRTGPDGLMTHPFFKLIEQEPLFYSEIYETMLRPMLKLSANKLKQKMKENSRLLLSETEIKNLNNVLYLRKLVKRNLQFLDVLLMTKGDFGFIENKKNEDIWYHHLINKETPDNSLQFVPNPGEQVLLDVPYGIQEMLVVRNKKVEDSQKGYIKTGKETGPSTQNYDARNQKACLNGLMISPLLSANTPLDNFKNDLANNLQKVICGSETTKISSIILLCWSLGYDHLTLISSNCRAESSTYKGFRAQTDESKTIGNVKNQSIFKVFEEKYKLIRKSAKRKSKSQSQIVKRRNSSTKSVRNLVNNSKKCPKGKQLYEQTKRCRKIIKKCVPPKKLYKPTNRCRTKKCQPGKKLFKPTNRCRKITKKCPEGKYLFIPTNRCRKTNL